MRTTKNWSVNCILLEKDVNKLLLWCLENEMRFHEDKCSITFIKKRGQVKMCDQIVKTVNRQKDLGVVVTENFN